jgi:hypothetical protein
MLKSLISEVEGSYGRSTSFRLLGCLVSGLTHVDEIGEWVNDKAYKGRLSDIKKLVQTHVVPALNDVLLENRADVLVSMLGTEFQLDNGTLSVTNRFGRWTDIGCLAQIN